MTALYHKRIVGLSTKGAVVATKKAPKKEPVTINCGDCDHKNPEGSVVCERCGYEL